MHYSENSKPLRLTTGSTIVELLIVIVVIAILAVITIVAFNGVQARAAESSLKSDLRNAGTVLENDRTVAGKYPSDANGANQGAGLKRSGGNTLTYGGGGDSYCASATNSRTNKTFHIKSGVGQVKDGPCEVVVTSLAGSTRGFADGSGAAAQFSYPYGVAVDLTGTIYIADTDNNRIRKVTTAGIVTTLAGSTIGYMDGTGTAAQFRQPYALAVDSSGVVYVADSNNHKIRKITPAGVVSTLAGSTAGYADGSGAAAQFDRPRGIAVDDAGVVYVADTQNHRIRKITPAGVVTTLAGSGALAHGNGTGVAAQFWSPVGIATDSSGAVYVTDNYNRIRKITPAGLVTSLPGYGDNEAVMGGGHSLFDIDVDESGNMYVTKTQSNTIYKITPAGVLTTLAGSSSSGYQDGVGTVARFNGPGSVAVDAFGTVYIADIDNHKIRKITQ